MFEARRRRSKTIIDETSECFDDQDEMSPVREMAIGVLPSIAWEALVLNRILGMLPAICLGTSIAWAA